MDRMHDKLAQYRKAYQELTLCLQRLNVMGMNQPYRSYFQTFEKDLAHQELILNAVMGLAQPPALIFMSYERPSNGFRDDEGLGAKVPIPPYLEHFNVSRDYQEDRDE